MNNQILLSEAVLLRQAHIPNRSKTALSCSSPHVPTQGGLLSDQIGNQMFCQHVNNPISRGTSTGGSKSKLSFTSKPYQAYLIHTQIARNYASYLLMCKAK